MHYYTVDSVFGTFEVTGDGALRKLVRELHAIAALRGIKQTEAFVDAVKHAAAGPMRLGKSLITDPVDTVIAIPQGVFSIFSNVAESITMTHDPSEDSRVEQMLFVSSWKRDYAAQMGVDVYSSNKVLQEELNSVGWAAAIGGLTISAATMGADATAAIVLKQMRLADSVRNVLKAEPPPRLRIINMDKLKAMGVPPRLAEKFLDHPHFTPRHDTIIVACLDALGAAQGRDVFLNAALRARDEVGANFYMNIAQIMCGYNDSVARIRRITNLGGFVIAQAETGTAFIPAALDHGIWAQCGSQVMSNLITTYRAPGFNGRLEFWITGTLSPLARAQLAQLGIQVVDNVDERLGLLD